MIRTYSELIQLSTFEERYKYLRLYGKVGTDTFGFDRIFNQMFYRSEEWKQIRQRIIVRDNACDLAVPGRELYDRIFIHHMNPISIRDIRDSSEFLMNPEYLIVVSFSTHNAIHYGMDNRFELEHHERTPYDTCPWKNGGYNGD